MKINSKLKALEWSQQISYYKAMGIFPDAKGQLTPQFKVWSEILWLSLLPARMEKIQSKMKALEWSQHLQVTNGQRSLTWEPA